MRLRFLAIGLLLLTVGLSHWLTPSETYFFHALHVAMRKMFLLPVILAAIWFNRRGACVTASVATAVYVPHVYFHWSGQATEQLNQASDVLLIWGIALLAGWLVGREKAALQKASQSHRATVHALVAALDAREHDTERHSHRVRAYSLRIGQSLALARDEMGVLEQAALLHDVGKIGVPDHILQKPGPLDDGERKIMRRHPEIGYRMLHRIPLLQYAAEAVYAHHERFDGTGYPRGLCGSSIPLVARIFAVADAFDALISNRPYRKAVSVGTAREVIQRERGRQFDPTVVDAFLNIPVGNWVRLREAVDGEPPIIIELRAGCVSLE